LDNTNNRDYAKSAIIDPAVTVTEQVTSPIVVVAECDLAEAIPGITVPRAGMSVLVLARIFGEPIGMVDVMSPANSISPDDLAGALVSELEPQLRDRFIECGLPWDGKLPVGGLHPPRTPSFLTNRERVMCEGPFMTIAICTRDHPESLAITLESLSKQEYQRSRVLVVDNAPSDDRTCQVVKSAMAGCGLDIDYVIEPRPGVSWARNRAIEASDSEVIAFIDDDERADRWWAAELARGFVENPEACAVTGAIVPGELATESQVLFERYFGIRAGRGFTRAVFSPETARDQSPLYPRPPFGATGNMAARRDALDRIGRFDCALGTGTMTQGCEDTAALSALLLEGLTIVYQPTAIVHHYYHRDYAALRRQLQGYGRGLTSFYISMLARRPSCLVEILRLGGKAARDRFSRRARQPSNLGEDFPRDLLRANLVGRLQGPFAYAAARVQARRLRHAVSA
jgi:glycosyltransferase involved in cell wall biosynthesis